MRDLTVGVFEHLDITSKIDLDIIIKYTEHILRGSALEKNRQVLLVCKESSRGFSGNIWTIGADKSVTMEQFCTWDKIKRSDSDGDTIIGAKYCT